MKTSKEREREGLRKRERETDKNTSWVWQLGPFFVVVVQWQRRACGPSLSPAGTASIGGIWPMIIAVNHLSRPWLVDAGQACVTFSGSLDDPWWTDDNKEEKLYDAARNENAIFQKANSMFICIQVKGIKGGEGGSGWRQINNNVSFFFLLVWIHYKDWDRNVNFHERRDWRIKTILGCQVFLFFLSCILSSLASFYLYYTLPHLCALTYSTYSLFNPSPLQ